MKFAKKEWFRAGMRLGLWLVWTLLSSIVSAQGVSTTTVQGTAYLANGRAGSGSLQISWPAFTTANSQAITAGRLNVTIGSDGFVSVNLAPNQGASPAGLYYTAIYHLNDGTTSTEYWVVPAAAQASLSQVRAQVMPAAQAVQAVSKSYVDQSMQELTQSLLTASGGSLSGPLYLSSDPTTPTQAANKHYVDSALSQAVPITGGAATGPLTSVQLGAAYQVDQFAGADFGTRLQACLNQLNATYGGTCDARNFTGTLAMASNLSITTSNATVQLPCATVSTANQIVVAAGTRNVSLRGCALRGASNTSGSQGGTVFLYSGSGAMIQVGDATYGADTAGFHMDNAVINTTTANSGTAQGLAAYRTQELDLVSLYLLGNSNQTGLLIDGTGNYAGGTFQDIQISGYGTAVSGIGHQAANAATTDWLNASAFVRLHIDCPTSNGNPINGTYGINLLQGDGNTFTGGDVEGCGTALHLGPNAQNNTIVGLRNENSINQVVAEAGSSYNNWMTGGTMFTGQLTDNGTRNSFLDTFHRSFNGLNGDWYGSQQDATVTNHYRIGTGTGNERGLLNRYQTDSGYRWTTGFSDATAGQQFYQLLDELNNVYRLSIGQYNYGQGNTNNQTVINAAGTGAVVLNGSSNAGTGGVLFGAGGSTGTTVASVSNTGNAQFNGSLSVGGPSTFTNSTTVKNQTDAEIDSFLWAGATTNQKESYVYKDYLGASQWYMVKDASNNWALNSATGGLDSFKAYQSNNSGDTYINASNPSGHIRLNYETGAGSETDIYSGTSSGLVAAFLGSTSIKLPGLAATSGHYCLQIDNSGYLSNTGSACNNGLNGTVSAGTVGQVAYYSGNGTAIAGTSAVSVNAGGTGASTAAQALQNLGGQQAVPGLSSDGASGIAVTGKVTALTAVAQTMGGLRYATQYPAGGGNKGIANAIAANATVVADPGYGNTEIYKFNSPIPGLTGSTHVEDLRNGQQADLFTNWNYSATNSFDYVSAAQQTDCITNNPWIGTSSASAYCQNLFYSSTIPGNNIGNPNVPPAGGGMWQFTDGRAANLYINGSGIGETSTCGLYKYGVGDAICQYHYTYSAGGATGRSDEGTKGIGNNVSEATILGSGTASTTYPAGATLLKLNGTSCNAQAGSCAWGTGRYVIDVTAGATATNITGMANGLNPGTEAVLVAGTVAVSNAWGTLNANVQPNFSAAPPFTTSMTFNVTLVGGTGFDITHLVCFSDQFHDCAVPTVATNISGSTWSLTIPVRKPHGSGTYIFQGGMAGYGLENDIMSATAFGAGNTAQRYLIDVLGSTTANTLQVTFFGLGSQSKLPFAGSFGAEEYGSFNVSSISSSGNSVYVIFGSNNMGNGPLNRNNANYVFSGASDSALNGTVCTNAQFVTGASFTCTMAGLSGTHVAATAIGVLANSSGTLYSAVNVWPTAEVLDVQNEALNPPAMDGTITLEQNILRVTGGDVLTEMNHYAGRFSAETGGITTYNPYDFVAGFNFGCGGPGCQGGGYPTGVNALLPMQTSSSDSYYFDAGGTLMPLNFINNQGAYFDFLQADHGPAQTGQFILVNPTAAQKANPNYYYPLFNLYNNTGNTTLTHWPNQGDVSLVTPGQVTLAGTSGGITFGSALGGFTADDSITGGTLATPVAPTLSVVPGAGTLADFTQYCYRMVAKNSVGSSLPSSEVCATTGTTGGLGSAIKIAFPRQAGVSQYSVYGRTQGAELGLISANNQTGLVLVLMDNGSVTPSGSYPLPTTNTTLGYLNNWAGVKLNSSGTSYTANVVSPPSVAATYTENLPATGTTGTLVDMATSASVVGDVMTFVNTTGRVQDSGTLLSSLAPKVSPAFTGTPTAPTPATPDNSTSLATTAYVKAQAYLSGVKISVSITPAAATASQCVEQTFNTFTGLATGQSVRISPPSSLGAHIWIGETRVSATNTLAISFCGDATAGTPPSGTYIAVAF